MTDDELERLKARRLAEMQKNVARRDERPPTGRELLVRRLGYRGLEVLRNAESQYPSETGIIVSKLGELISSGELDEQLDGGRLLALFRSVGIYVRMQTKISVEQDGKMVSLSDRLSSRD